MPLRSIRGLRIAGSRLAGLRVSGIRRTRICLPRLRISGLCTTGLRVSRIRRTRVSLAGLRIARLYTARLGIIGICRTRIRRTRISLPVWRSPVAAACSRLRINGRRAHSGIRLGSPCLALRPGLLWPRLLLRTCLLARRRRTRCRSWARIAVLPLGTRRDRGQRQSRSD
jgi:hypothetical protein